MPILYSSRHAAGNPYQRMIYGAFAGYVQRSHALAALADGQLPDAGTGDIYWIHWETVDFGIPQDAAAQTAARDRIAEGLSRLRAQGVRIVWTVHNFLPHNLSRDMDAIHAGRRVLAELADLVHVHTAHAREVMTALYGLSADRVCMVAHPSYFGQYEPEADTLARRDVLPVCDRRAFIHVGKVQQNRGGRFLWRGLRALAARRDDWSIDVAGAVSRGERRGMGSVAGLDTVRIRDAHLPDAELRQALSQAQVCVAPFERLFTSGSVNLALTFGLPVIGPDINAMRDHLPDCLHDRLYAPGNKRAFMFRMRDYIDLDDAELLELRRASMEFAWDRRAERQSVLLRDAVESLSALPDTPSQQRVGQWPN